MHFWCTVTKAGTKNAKFHLNEAKKTSVTWNLEIDLGGIVPKYVHCCHWEKSGISSWIPFHFGIHWGPQQTCTPKKRHMSNLLAPLGIIPSCRLPTLFFAPPPFLPQFSHLNTFGTGCIPHLFLITSPSYGGICERRPFSAFSPNWKILRFS